MKRIISFQMLGGLGNILFPLATAYALSKEFGLELKIKYDHIGYLHTDPKEYQNLFLKKFNQIDEDERKFGFFVTEVGCGYEQIKIPQNHSVLLCGYFQSEKYFSSFREEICDIASPSKEKLFELKSYLAHLIGDSPCVSLHIRRKNYLSLEDHHVNLPIDYYRKALTHFPKHKVLIFSDDIEYCKNLFPECRDIFFVESGDILKIDIDEMNLMSLCNHNIIANSTFSWWGAWLNRNKDKKVIAPERWYGPTKIEMGHHTKDLIPDKWIQI